MPLGDVIGHVRDCYREPLDNAQLARVAGLSQRTFERQFRRHYGLSPQQYIKRVRVRTACRAWCTRTSRSRRSPPSTDSPTRALHPRVPRRRRPDPQRLPPKLSSNMGAANMAHQAPHQFGASRQSRDAPSVEIVAKVCALCDYRFGAVRATEGTDGLRSSSPTSAFSTAPDASPSPAPCAWRAIASPRSPPGAAPPRAGVRVIDGRGRHADARAHRVPRPHRPGRHRLATT